MGQEPDILNAFFSTLLPQKSQTEYYQLWVPSKGNIPCGDVEEAVNKALNFYRQTDCYFSLCSSANSKHRRAQDLVAGKALAFDIDIKGIDHHTNAANYSTTAEARAALEAFCNATHLTPTYIVQSGSGGLHVYFALTTATSALTRLQMQRALASLAQEKFNLHIDPNALLITQVLRVPFTLHTRSNNPVTILEQSPVSYDTEQLLQLLTTLYPHYFSSTSIPTSSSTRVPPRSRDVSVQTQSDYAFGFNAPSPLYPAQEIFNVLYRCKHICLMADSGYKNWFGALSILAHFANGYECAKQLSQIGEESKYDELAFEKQWDNLVLDRPQTCDLFEQYETINNKYCQTCPYHGKIKSPIALHATTDLTTVLPAMLESYKQIFPTVPTVTPSTNPPTIPTNLTINNPIQFGTPLKFTPIPMSYHLNQFYQTTTNPYETFIIEEKTDRAGNVISSVKKRLFNGVLEFLFTEQFMGEYETKQSRYHFLVHTGQQTPYEIILEKFHNTRQVIDAIYDNGLIIGSAGEKVVANFLSAYTTEVMNSANPPIQMANNSYGWKEYQNTKGFMTDEGLITADRLIPAVMRGFSLKHDGVNNRRFYSQGVLHEWQEAMDVYPTLGQTISQFVILLSFASPLFSQTIPEIGSAILNLYGGSGIGKSTVLHAAMSVWGNPLNTSIKGSSVAVQKLLGMMNNMPCCIEEMLVTISDPVQLGSLIFQLIDGTEKTRLSQKADVKEAATWSNAILCAANQPLKEALLAYTNAHNATQLRVVDVPFSVQSYTSDQPELKLIKAGMTKFRNNFGIAGPLFIQWCLQNWHEVANLHKRVEGLIEKYNLPAEHRYLTYPLALTVLTCDLIKRAGILNWDFTAIEEFAFKRMYYNLISEINDTVESPLQQFANFISSQMANNCLIVDHNNLTPNERKLIKQGQIIPNYILAAYPKGEVNLRWAVQDCVLTIRRSALKMWALRQGYSAANIIREITSTLNGAINFQNNHIKLYRGIVGSVGNLQCHGFMLTEAQLIKLGVLDTIKETAEVAVSNFQQDAPPQPAPDDFHIPDGYVYVGDGHIRLMTEVELKLYRALILKQSN